MVIDNHDKLLAFTPHNWYECHLIEFNIYAMLLLSQTLSTDLSSHVIAFHVPIKCQANRR